MKTINLGTYKLPVQDFASQGNAVLGIRGSGKTYTATYLAEQLLQNGIPFVAFDPIGIWRFLKVPGKGKGYPVVVAGGKHGDLPLTPDSAPAIVRAAMKDNIPLILDLYSMDMSKADWRRIVESATRLLLYENKDYGLRHIFIEEAAEFCLDVETEILTKSGFKKYTDIKVGESAVSYNLTNGKFGYDPIERIIVKDHNGPMVQIRARSIDCLMTPEHRAVVQRFQHDPARYKMYPPTFCKASSLPYGFRMIAGGAPEGPGEDISDEMLRVLGWVITDGWFHHKAKSNLICIQQSEGTIKRGISIRDEMRKALEKLGCIGMYERQPRLNAVNPQGQLINTTVSTSFFLGAKLSKEIFKWLGEDIHRVPRCFLENCSQRQLEILYLGLLEGDGTSQNGKWRYFYPGLERGLADDFQELATRLGIRTVLSFVKSNRQWRVSIANRNDHWCYRSKDNPHYEGKVWCVTLRTGAFVARRNGTIFVTGNCPQQLQPDQGKVYAEIEKLARMGGNASLGYTLINQRAEQVNKAVLELCDFMCLHRQKGKNSIKAIKEWISLTQTDEGEKTKEIIQSLPNLKPGEAWVWGDGTLIKLPEKNSFHPDRKNPEAEAKPGTDVGKFVQQLKGSLAEHLEKIKANDPAVLQKRIRELELELKKKPVQEVKEKPIFTEQDRKHFTSHALGISEDLKEIKVILDTYRAELGGFVQIIGTITNAQTVSRPKVLEPEQRESFALSKYRPKQDSKVLERNGTIPTGARKILIALSQRSNLTKQQLAVRSGFAQSGTFSNYLSILRQNGFMESNGIQHFITKQGVNYLGDDFTPLPEGKELFHYWQGQLPTGAAHILSILWQSNGLSKNELAETSGFQLSGTFSNYLSKLNTLELIRKQNGLYYASEELYD